MKFKTFLKNELEKDRTLAKRLAGKAGYKNTTPLYKYLNDDGREFDCLSRLIKIIEVVCPEDEKRVMSTYAKNVDPTNKLSRHLLDYFSLHLMDDDRIEITERMLNCSNAESRQWAEIYNIRHNITDYEERLRVLEDFHTKSIELSCFKRIMIFGCYCNIENISVIKWMYPRVKRDIEEEIKSEYIRSSYLIRTYQIMALILLYLDKPQESRELCSYVLEGERLDTYSKAIVNHIKGMTYLFDDYDLGVKYLNRAKELYETHSDKSDGEVSNSILLHEIYWKRDKAQVTFTSDKVSEKHNQIYYYYFCDKVELAKELLTSISEDDLMPIDLAFQRFSEGLVYNSLDKFVESVKIFKSVDEHFHMNLPLMHLKSFGLADNIIEMIKH